MVDLVDVARTSVTGTNVTGTFLVRENWKEWARATARSPTPHGVPDPTREISRLEIRGSGPSQAARRESYAPTWRISFDPVQMCHRSNPDGLGHASCGPGK